MHARHGQGAAAAQARPPRSKLSDLFHLWVNNIRLLYSWSHPNSLAPLQLPSSVMGNLQSDGKKRQKKKEPSATAPLPAASSTSELDAAVAEEPRKDSKRDQTPAAHDGPRDEPCDRPREPPIKISFERMQTPGHAKRQAPRPPKIVLPKDTQESAETACRKDTAVTAAAATETCRPTTMITTTATTTITPTQTPTTPQTQQLPPLLVTDSWRLANKGLVVTDMPTPPSQESSSDSVFTDPGELGASPQGLAIAGSKSSPESPPDARKDRSPFKISKHKKIQLSVLSPRIPASLNESTATLSPTWEGSGTAPQRRHSINERPTSEGTVLRRVASLTLDRTTVKRRVSSKSAAPQKADRRKQSEGQNLSIRPTSTLTAGRIAKRDASSSMIDWTDARADGFFSTRTKSCQTYDESSVPVDVHRYEEEVKKLRDELERLREVSAKRQASSRCQSTQTSPRSSSPVDRGVSDAKDLNAGGLSSITLAQQSSAGDKIANRPCLSHSRQTNASKLEQPYIPPPPPPPPSSPFAIGSARSTEKTISYHPSSSELSDISRIPTPPPPPPPMSTHSLASTFIPAFAPPPPPPTPISSTGIPPPPPPPPPPVQSIINSIPPPSPPGSMSAVPPPPPPPSSFVPSVPMQSAVSGIPPPPPPPPPPPMPVQGIAGETPAKIAAMNVIPPPPPPPTPMLNVCGVSPPPPPPPQPPSLAQMMGADGAVPPPPPPPLPSLAGVLQKSLSGPPPAPPLPGMQSGIPPPPPPPIAGSGGNPPPPPPMAPPAAPGATGPCPLPAPPVGGWNLPSRTVMRKQPLNPDVPMKPLYWTRILVPATPTSQASAEASASLPQVPLWLELAEEENINMKEFADLFSRQVREKKLVKKNDVMPKGFKIQPAKILDSKRSKMVGILEKSLHIDFSEIENAAYNLDTSVISLEALQQIYEIKPTEEEIALIAAHESMQPEIPLDQPELFLKRLAGIKHFSERIACLMLQSEFQDAISSLSYKLNNVQTTCDFLVKSDSLRKVIAIILTLGNYMNGGNMMRGQADGFGLEILGKLKDVKSNTPGVTLLHYVVNAKLSQEKDHNFDEPLPLPVPEPADVEAASTIKFDDIAKELERLEKELNACARKCNMVVEADPATSKVFKKKVDSFMARANTELASGKEELLEARNKFKSVMRFYQFIPKGASLETAEPYDFFNLWLGFCRDFKDIWKKEQQRIRKEQLEEVRRKLENKSDVVRVKMNPHGLKARLQKLTTKKQTHR